MNDSEIILRAISVIDETIVIVNAYEKDPSFDVNKLKVIQENLGNLFSLISLSNNLVHLFCRRLNRLMNYNDTISIGNWFQLETELLHILKHYNDPIEKLSHMDVSLLLNLENKLEEREIQFKEKFTHRKTFHELVKQHRIILEEYLQSCYSFHSKLKIHGLVKNVDDLLQEFYRQRCILQIDAQTSAHLQTKLNSIEIPLKYPFHELQRCIPKSFLDFGPRNQLIGNDNVFLPGMDNIRIWHDYGYSNIHQNLKEHRWIVILGDPGSSKTTLLRYITQLFSSTALQVNEKVIDNGNNWGILRIPILIRIGEFSEKLNIQPNLTLFDYIGKHTWFSQVYGNDNIEYILKEFIHHGHALILLDGLDEISQFHQGQQILNLIQDFICQYVHGEDFLSPFDDVPKDFNNRNRSLMTNETRQMDNWRFNET